MKVEIKVPAMGESISSATVGTLLKPSGSSVAADEEIIELETDKVNQVLYAPQAGVLTWSVAPQDVVKIGQLLGYVETEAAAKPEAPKQEAPKKEEPKQEAPKKEEPKQEAPKKEEPKPEASKQEASKKEEPKPEAPKQEASKKEEPKPEAPKQEAPKKEEPKQEVPKPSEAGVRKTRESIVEELQRPPPLKPNLAALRETRRKISKVRRVIGERLMQVQQTTASLTTFNEVDMTQVLLLRDKYKELFAKKHGVRLGFMSFFVKAVVSALQAFPDFNSYLDGDELVHREYYDIGVAVGTEKGVFVPVIRNADQLTYSEIEAAIVEYANKAKEGKIGADDLQGGGFTITNGGVYGSLLSTPILNPPQCAILGMHKIEKRAVVLEDEIVIRSMMYLALTYDHRIVDGKEAVSFLVHIKNMLEDPARQVLHV